MKFINKMDIKKSLEGLNRGMAVTVGEFEYTTQSHLEDMEWNHMDQLHRPFIHKTYEEAIRIATDKNFATSLTRWGRWPIFITVTDVRVDKGLFYQCMTLAGLIYIHLVIEMTQIEKYTKTILTWNIASHRFLKFLHPILSRKFFKLNTRLQEEDAEIRDRRYALREAGYTFKSDPVDYLSSNQVSCNTIPPDFLGVMSINLSTLSESKSVIEVGRYEFIIVRDKPAELLIWPGVCPHEGARLSNGVVCEDKITCPWHGLKFSAVHLSSKSPIGSRYGFNFELQGECLLISTAATVRQGNPECVKVACVG